jgi:hypothetical protein
VTLTGSSLFRGNRRQWRAEKKESLEMGGHGWRSGQKSKVRSLKAKECGGQGLAFVGSITGRQVRTIRITSKIRIGRNGYTSLAWTRNTATMSVNTMRNRGQTRHRVATTRQRERNNLEV